MKFTIQVLIESPNALPLSVPIQTIERSRERVEDVGLRLIELRSPPWFRCACEEPSTATYSALNKILTTHTAPA